jgi:hypothetical protein
VLSLSFHSNLLLHCWSALTVFMSRWLPSSPMPCVVACCCRSEEVARALRVCARDQFVPREHVVSVHLPAAQKVPSQLPSPQVLTADDLMMPLLSLPRVRRSRTPQSGSQRWTSTFRRPTCTPPAWRPSSCSPARGGRALRYVSANRTVDSFQQLHKEHWFDSNIPVQLGRHVLSCETALSKCFSSSR